MCGLWTLLNEFDSFKANHIQLSIHFRYCYWSEIGNSNNNRYTVSNVHSFFLNEFYVRKSCRKSNKNHTIEISNSNGCCSPSVTTLDTQRYIDGARFRELLVFEFDCATQQIKHKYKLVGARAADLFLFWLFFAFCFPRLCLLPACQ